MCIKLVIDTSLFLQCLTQALREDLDSVRHLYSAVISTTVIDASSHASVDDIKWVDTCRTPCQQSINYAHFHSIIKYGFYFCGNSSNSKKIFTLQKKMVRIMAGAQHRTLCRSLFKQLETLVCSMPVCTFINELHYQ